jgi:hypothetical protein
LRDVWDINTVGLLEGQDRHFVLGGEGRRLAAEAVADLLKECGPGDREPEALGEECDYLAAR